MFFKIPGEFLIPAILLGFLVVLLAVVAIRFFKRRFQTSGYAQAEIIRLIPRFDEENPLRTQHLACTYEFTVRDKIYTGQCILPLSCFMATVLPPGPVIIYDVRVDMPVLISDDLRVVGEELIEHQLLDSFHGPRVRYMIREPSRNDVIEIGGLRGHKIQNISNSPRD